MVYAMVVYNIAFDQGGMNNQIFLLAFHEFPSMVISAITVCFMCPIMSFIATVLFQGVNSDLIANWLQISVRNFPMALCWQIFYAGPLVRWSFGKIFRQGRERATAPAA